MIAFTQEVLAEIVQLVGYAIMGVLVAYDLLLFLDAAFKD